MRQFIEAAKAYEGPEFDGDQFIMPFDYEYIETVDRVGEATASRRSTSGSTSDIDADLDRRRRPMLETVSRRARVDRLRQRVGWSTRPRRVRFGEFGGRYVPETLVPACPELEEAFRRRGPTRRSAPSSTTCCATTPGGPSPLTECHRLSEELGGVRVLLKREDLNHTGSHKINNVLGQALLAKRMGKTRLVAETGAGQHGVATATPRRCWAWSASCTWARSTWSARS